MSKVHSTAIVSEKAVIADDVEIGPFSIIGPDVKIGKGCKLDSYVHIKGKVEIGENNTFYNGVFIGESGQDLTVKNPIPSIKIGNNNHFREFVTIHQPSKEGNITTVGNNNFLMGHVHLAHDVKLANNIIIVQNSILAGYIEVQDKAYISGLVAVHQFVKIGKYTLLGGGSKVTLDPPPYTTSTGHPSAVHGLNLIGMRRSGLSKEVIRTVKEIYKILYLKNYPPKKSLITLEALLKEYTPDNESYQPIMDTIEFIKNSKRGLMAKASKDLDVE